MSNTARFPQTISSVWRHAAALLAAIALAAALPWASAQLASGEDPATVADQAVRTWSEQESLDLGALLSAPAEEVCRDLPALVGNPPPPAGTEVNLEDRQPREVPEPDRRSFTYPAELPSGELDVVQVDLQQSEGIWNATSVGFRPTGATGRAWLADPLVGVAFLLLSVAAVFFSIRTSFLRSWLLEGFGLLRKHRGIFIGTMILIYGSFALGALTGSALPEACGEAVLTVIQDSLEAAGAIQAIESGNIVRAAVTIFYQNFAVVNIVLFFTLALMFGVPAYLGAAVILFANGIPFGLVGGIGLLQLLFIAILIFLELTAHAVVVAGGGIFVRTLITEGFGSYSVGIRRLLLMVPIAFLLLLVGAWYESLLIVPWM